MSDLEKNHMNTVCAIPASCLTIDQIDAITHAWLDLCAMQEHFESEEQFTGVGADELAVACKDSVEELEKEFPFLMEGVEDAS